MIYEIGFNRLEEFEGEDGKIHKIPQFKDLCRYDLKENLNEEQQKKLLNLFINKNKEKLINQKIPISDLVINKHNNINFNEMVNTFKGGGLK
jgi:hypothetical protein